jgi:hypothetical protein
MRELARVSKLVLYFVYTLEPRFFIDRILHANEETAMYSCRDWQSTLSMLTSFTISLTGVKFLT